MPTPILMPQLGESVTEGTVARWLKREGERVERDEPLLEVSTDKVNAEMPSPVAGILVKLSVAEGSVVAIGAEVGQIEESATAFAELKDAGSGSSMQIAAPVGEPANSVEAVAGNRGTEERRRYSPLVRRLAAEHHLDLRQLRGTGMGGRITKDDVLAHMARTGNSAATDADGDTRHPDLAGRVTRDAVLDYVRHDPERQASAAAPVSARHEPVAAEVAAPVVSPPNGRVATGAQPGVDEEWAPLSPMRRGIAEHMVRSVYTAPHATTVTEIDMTALVRWRDRHKDAYRDREGVEITYVAFVVQAVVAALKAFPYLNASWGGDKIVLKKAVNIGIAVGMDDGLLVPVIHHADERSLVGIARAVADLALRARSRRLTVNELQGGTFTVNNTGVFGSIVSTPVINQPQAAILSMEAIVKRPVVRDDAIAIRSIMNICLSFDHRLIDGLMAGRFSQKVKQHLELFPLPEMP